MEFDDKTQQFDRTKILNHSNSDGGGRVRAACLIVLSGAQAGRLYKLDEAGMLIGRAADVGIRLEDEGVSRHHARISQAVDGHLIEDLGSTNGTYCNGERISRHMLQDGDKVQVGSASILKFSYQDAVDEDFQRRQYEWATRDALTGCFNKKYFLDRLPDEFAFAHRHRQKLCVAMLDIDHFKQINDTYGHPVGDYVLRGIGQVLQSMTRRSDVLARYGGEEFALIMRQVELYDAQVVLERIRHYIAEHHFEFNQQVIPVTISLGLAVYPTLSQAVDNAEQLVKMADTFLYRAKARGRNRTESELTA